MDESSCVSAPKRRLEGKVAIITGGASGIGATTVRVFVENGAKVVIADIQDPQGEEIATKIGENAHYIHCDVSKENDVKNLINATISKFGHLDIMYNNAGIYDTSIKSILDTETVELERKIAVNLIGSFLGAKYVAKVMVPRKKGCILFTTSCSTEVAGLASHTYVASKCGVVGMCKNLAAELGLHGIRVNCISPFAILSSNKVDNEIEARYEAMIGAIGNLKGIPHNKEDVANAAVFLASDEGKYLSGHNLVIDGGFSVVNPSFLKITGQYQ
ncbi:(+)-borneol dehydrogenase 1-like [Lycium ferocissimum]|uniref:(+)-borneol dehydrogenase 1-like n=1 Tax=Lycium ferocissimum TaxID=112874 RepID=UPI0028166E08|nr:(+)-borneol dehydrogenase 1-like [Lycium ferocissimum]